MKRIVFFALSALALTAVSCDKGKPDPEPGKTGIVLNEINGNDKYVEIFNGGLKEVDMTGYALYKDGSETPVWVCSDASQKTLASQSYLVIDFVKGTTDPTQANSGISAKKNLLLQLKDATGKSVDVFTRGYEGSGWGDTTLPENTECSFNRTPNGSGEWSYALPTKGAVNGEYKGDIEQGDKPVPPSDAKVCLNEIDGNNKFIELYNAGTSAADISGFSLKKDGKTVWTCKDNSQKSIAAKGYLAIDCEKDSEDPTKASCGLSAKKNLQLVLYDGSGAEKSRFERGKEGAGWGEETLPENKSNSFSCTPDGSGNWHYAVSTKAAANGASTGDIEQNN